jgi:mono/diheme cytochrome c family protein
MAAPAVLTISVVSIGATTVLTAGLGFGPATRANWLVPPFAALLFMLGAIGLFSGEFLREAGRKPYTIEGYLYSNNIRVADAAAVQTNGYINSSRWVRASLQTQVPALFDVDRKATSSTAAALSEADRHIVGEAIYENQCGTCHTRRGYNALLPRLSAANLETTRLLITRMNQVSHAMPPWLGQDWEAELVAEFLNDEAKGTQP